MGGTQTTVARIASSLLSIHPAASCTASAEQLAVAAAVAAAAEQLVAEPDDIVQLAELVAFSVVVVAAAAAAVGEWRQNTPESRACAAAEPAAADMRKLKQDQ